MENTKNDLSGGLAKIDFQAMLSTSAYAVKELTEQASKHISAIRESHLSNDMTKLWLNANWLKNVSLQLAVACETYATLKGVLENREIEIVNKP